MVCSLAERFEAQTGSFCVPDAILPGSRLVVVTQNCDIFKIFSWTGRTRIHTIRYVNSVLTLERGTIWHSETGFGWFV